MIRLLMARLFGHNTEPVCGVADYVVGLPEDLGCRDTATRRVVFHCEGCGPRSRDVCSHHERALHQDPNATCEVCVSAGQPAGALTFMHSTLVGAA